MFPLHHPAILSFVRRFAPRFLAVAVLAVVAGYLTLLLPLSVGKYLEICFASGTGKTRALQMLGIQLPNRLTAFFCFFVLVMMLQFLVSWGYRYMAAWLGERFVGGLRHQLFLEQVEGKQAISLADSMMVYASEARHAYQWMVKGCIGFFKQVSFSLMALYVLISISWQITLVVLAAATSFFYLYQQLHLKFEPWFHTMYQRRKSWLRFVSMVLSQGDAVDEPVRQYQRKYRRFQEVMDQSNRRKALLQAAAPLLMYLLLGMVMLVIAVGDAWLQLPSGMVLTYMLLLMTVLPAMRSLIKVSQVWMNGASSMKKYQKFSVSGEPSGPTSTGASQSQNATALLAGEKTFLIIDR